MEHNFHQRIRNSIKLSLVTSAAVMLGACASNATKPTPQQVAVKQQSKQQTTRYLAQGRASFLAKNYDKAFSELIIPASHGNAQAQYAIGYMYYYGKGVKQNQAAGMKWIKKSADQGYPQAVKSLKIIAAEQAPRTTSMPLRHHAIG